MRNMTLQNIAHAIHGQLFLPDNYIEEGKVAQGVVIDNRKVVKDYIFVPIKGARVDGHTFIPNAFE